MSAAEALRALQGVAETMWGSENERNACTSVGEQAVPVQCNAQVVGQNTRSAAATASSHALQGRLEGSRYP